MTRSPLARDPRFRKMHMMKDVIGLTNAELVELAEVICRRDFTSLTQLDEEQVLRLLDAMEGFEKIALLLSQRA